MPLTVCRPHWNARYVRDRLALIAWERRHPDAPWLTPVAVALLEQLLRPSDRVFEWGSGRSTRWFANRVANVTSIESSCEWHATVEAELRTVPTARCIHIPCRASSSEREAAAYHGAIDAYGQRPLDVILVDGLFRDHCALKAVDAVAPGGLIIVDDVERYLPSRSRAPNARTTCASETWATFAERVASWRCAWTTSGVGDTALWICPGLTGPDRTGPDQAAP